MGSIQSVEVVEPWVFEDLSASTFSVSEQSRVLDDVERLTEQLLTWNRPVSKCLSQLSDTGAQTLYRHRVGDLRAYYLREGETLYCIGVGKRKTTYDRDIDRMARRADEHRTDR